MMQEFYLKDISLKIGSGSTPKGGKESYKESGITLIRSMNVFDFKFKIDGLAFIDEKQASKLKNVEVKKSDILLNITGASVARCCMVPEELIPARVNQHVSIIRIDNLKANPTYVLNYLNSPAYKQYLLSLASAGATREALTKEGIENLKVKLPDLQIQKKIASILSAYDNLIENNNQRITLLEDMASEIYKEWFIRFRFPNYQNTNFLDKDGREVAQGTKGAIPEGWERSKLEKVVDFRVDNRGRNPEYYCEKGIPVLDNHLITNSPFVNLSKAKRFLDESLYSNFLRKYLEPNDVLITLVGTVADIAMAPVEKCAIIQNTIGIRCNDLCNQYFLYEFLKINKQNIINKNRGSAQPNVKVGDLLSIKMDIPSKEILDKYELTISTFFEQIKTLGKKNQILQETRDLLLPRLISGKLSVENLEVENT